MKRAPVVVAMGDSLTVGVGDGVDDGSAHMGWASHTACAVDAQALVNLAANGTRARDLATTQVPAALAANPDIVLMTAGGNDVLRGDFNPAEIARELHAVHHRLARPGRVVVTVALDRIGLFDLLPAPVSAVMGRRIGVLNEAIHDAAASAGALVVDGAGVFRRIGRSAWHIDRVHPSPLGHRAIANEALTAIARWWPQSRPVPLAPDPPHLVERTRWLVRNGAPWAVRRSRDLIPQVALAVARELTQESRVAARGR